MLKFRTYQTGKEVYPIGNIISVAQDREFVKWMADSKELKHYKSDKSLKSTAGKQIWIYKYLTLCRLTPKQIQELCAEFMDKEYPMFQKTISDQVILIEGVLRGAIHKGTFPQIRSEHIDMEELLND